MAGEPDGVGCPACNHISTVSYLDWLTSFGKVGPHLKQVTAHLGVHSGEFDVDDDGVDGGDGYDGNDGGDSGDGGDGGDGDNSDCGDRYDMQMMVSLNMLYLSFSWCEANIIKNSLVPIWPAAQFLFEITSLHTY